MSERLQRVEEQLQQMGVVSVKLSMAPGVEALSASTLADSAAQFLENYISGASAVNVNTAGDMPAAHS